MRRLTNGQGVDVVYDTVGKDTFVDSLHCLRARGMCVLVGNSSGLVRDFDPMELAEAGSVFLTRPHMQHYVKTAEEYAWRANDVLRWIQEGMLKVKIGHKFSWSRRSRRIGCWRPGKPVASCCSRSTNIHECSPLEHPRL